MRKITKEELDKILENHKHWIDRDVEGWQYMRADLSDTELRGVDLRKADLCEANLGYADLTGADLRNADLLRANLINADLRGACLIKTNLRDTNLCGADLRKADLYSANLYNANLCHADLSKAKNVPFIPYACPEVGEFIGFKKVDGFIVVLKILEDSKRLSSTTRKCRCDKALVIDIQNLDGTKANVEEVYSNYDENFVYKVGEIVSVDNFDENRWNEYSNRWNEYSTGIHFFINRQDAVDY